MMVVGVYEADDARGELFFYYQVGPLQAGEDGEGRGTSFYDNCLWAAVFNDVTRGHRHGLLQSHGILPARIPMIANAYD